MKIVVIDTLIQTVNFDEPVRGGLVKSAMLDVEALATRHQVWYAYYGKPVVDKPFQSLIIGPKGSKDWCLANGKSVSLCHTKLRSDSGKLQQLIADVDPDALIIHVCSKSQYLGDISLRFIDVPKIFVFHDGVSNDDLFGTAGIIATAVKLRKYGALLTVNSEYTYDTITQVLKNRFADISNYYPTLAAEIGDPETYKLFDRVYDYFVYYDPKIKIDVVSNGGYSVNIGRFQKKKGVLTLLDLHKHSDHVVRLYGVQDPVFDPGLNDYAKITDAVAKHSNYVLREALSDEELRKDAQAGNNIVISCIVEGFGYTAFEMGIFGMPCVILKRGPRHATEEYLKKIGAVYVSINTKGNRGWKADYYRAMVETKLSLPEKKENAQKFLDYFTLNNYVNERERFIEEAKTKIKNNKKTLF